MWTAFAVGVLIGIFVGASIGAMAIGLCRAGADEYQEVDDELR